MSEILTTARLILRSPERRDAADIMVLANNPRVIDRTARMPYPYRLHDALGFIDACAPPPPPDRRSFGLYLMRAREAFIGVCGFSALGHDPTPHLGYWIGEPYWGRGYATEAARAVMNHAFGRMGLPALCSGCQPANHASRLVLEKLGFKHRGTETIYAANRRRHEMIDRFVLDAADWQHP